jgi:hypothetical protein
MSIEDRLRGVLAEAVATEPPPERSPLEQVARRRRRRPLIAATVALALLLVAAAAFTGIRVFEARPVRPTSTVVPPDWKEFRDQEADLSFRYPPDWAVRTDLASAAYLVIVPAEFRDRRVTQSAELPFIVGVSGGGGGGGEGYYRIAAGEQTATGRLPNGRAYTEWTSVVNGRRLHDYSIDVGRVCTPGSSPPNCSAHSIRATLAADTAALMDRYRQVAMAIVGTLAPVSATMPSAGDRTRPPCRPDQWGLAPSPIWSFQGRSWIIEGQVRYPADGPACHLRVTVEVSVQRPDRTPMAVPGTPAPITIEGDLPEDRAPNDDPNSYADLTTPLTWRWAWQNWCRQPLGQTSVRIEAIGTGKSATVQAPPPENATNCQGLGRDAPWRISPWP